MQSLHEQAVLDLRYCSVPTSRSKPINFAVSRNIGLKMGGQVAAYSSKFTVIRSQILTTHSQIKKSSR